VLVGILALVLAGVLLVGGQTSQRSESTASIDDVQELATLRNHKQEEQEKQGPDYAVCAKEAEECGKLQAGCKAKSASRATAAKAKMATETKACRVKCTASKTAKNAKTIAISSVADVAVSVAVDGVSAKFPKLKGPLNVTESIIDTLVKYGTKIATFRPKVENAICQAGCYSEATCKSMQDFAKEKKAEMLCYYGQTKAYVVGQLLEEVGEIITWLHEWDAKISSAVKDRIDAVKHNISEQVHDLGQEILDDVKQTKQDAHDLMVLALNVTETRLEPIYDAYETVEAAATLVKSKIENLQDRIDELVATYRMIADLPDGMLDWSSAHRTDLASCVQWLLFTWLLLSCSS